MTLAMGLVVSLVIALTVPLAFRIGQSYPGESGSILAEEIAALHCAAETDRLAFDRRIHDLERHLAGQGKQLDTLGQAVLGHTDLIETIGDTVFAADDDWGVRSEANIYVDLDEYEDTREGDSWLGL